MPVRLLALWGLSITLWSHAGAIPLPPPSPVDLRCGQTNGTTVEHPPAPIPQAAYCISYAAPCRSRDSSCTREQIATSAIVTRFYGISNASLTALITQPTPPANLTVCDSDYCNVYVPPPSPVGLPCWLSSPGQTYPIPTSDPLTGAEYCVSYSIICRSGDSACTSQQIDTAAVIRVYLYGNQETVLALVAAPWMYMDVIACNTPLCGYTLPAALPALSPEPVDCWEGIGTSTYGWTIGTGSLENRYCISYLISCQDTSSYSCEYGQPTRQYLGASLAFAVSMLNMPAVYPGFNACATDFCNVPDSFVPPELPAPASHPIACWRTLANGSVALSTRQYAYCLETLVSCRQYSAPPCTPGVSNETLHMYRGATLTAMAAAASANTYGAAVAYCTSGDGCNRPTAAQPAPAGSARYCVVGLGAQSPEATLAFAAFGYTLRSALQELGTPTGTCVTESLVCDSNGNMCPPQFAAAEVVNVYSLRPSAGACTASQGMTLLRPTTCCDGDACNAPAEFAAYIDAAAQWPMPFGPQQCWEGNTTLASDYVSYLQPANTTDDTLGPIQCVRAEVPCTPQQPDCSPTDAALGSKRVFYAGVAVPFDFCENPVRSNALFLAEFGTIPTSLSCCHDANLCNSAPAAPSPAPSPPPGTVPSATPSSLPNPLVLVDYPSTCYFGMGSNASARALMPNEQLQGQRCVRYRRACSASEAAYSPTACMAGGIWTYGLMQRLVCSAITQGASMPPPGVSQMTCCSTASCNVPLADGASPSTMPSLAPGATVSVTGTLRFALGTVDATAMADPAAVVALQSALAGLLLGVNPSSVSVSTPRVGESFVEVDFSVPMASPAAAADVTSTMSAPAFNNILATLLRQEAVNPSSDPAVVAAYRGATVAAVSADVNTSNPPPSRISGGAIAAAVLVPIVVIGVGFIVFRMFRNKRTIGVVSTRKPDVELSQTVSPVTTSGGTAAGPARGHWDGTSV